MMDLKWIGAILVIAGCGGFGFLMALNYRREMTALRQLVSVLGSMSSELEYRKTPLPELCRKAAGQPCGCVKTVLLALADELDSQIAPDVNSCVSAALKKCPGIPRKTVEAFISLGYTLGQFDLEGQLRGLEAVSAACSAELIELEANRTQRTRGYQTLGLCAGAALAILLF